MTSFPHWTACPWAFILFICVIYLTLTADQHFTYNQTCFIYLSLPLRNMETFPPSPLSLFLLSPFLFLLPPAMGILLAVSRVTCAFWGRLLTGGAAPDSSSLSHGCKIAFPCLPATYWVPTSPHPCWSRGVIRHRYPPIWWDDVLSYCLNLHFPEFEHLFRVIIGPWFPSLWILFISFAHLSTGLLSCWLKG